MSVNNVLSAISIVLAFIATMISLRTYNNILKKEAVIMNIELTPFPVITSMTLKKKECKDIPYVKRFYNGNWSTNEISLNGQIEIEQFNKTNLEHKLFIEECLNNKEKVYFSRFENSNCLIFNLIKTGLNDRFFYEFCSTEVKFINYGALINGVQIEEVEVVQNNGESVAIKGVANNKMECVIPKDAVFTMTCDVVTENIGNSLCINDEKVYKSFDSRFDFLKRRMPDESLKYKKIVFKIRCWNINNDCFSYNLILEIGNGFLTTKTMQNTL